MNSAVQNRWEAEADYDRRFKNRNHLAYFGDSGFSNYGYWAENTRDPIHACATLVEKLIATFPAKSGNVLDVACGCGGTTSVLAKHFKPQAIVALNISRYQLEQTSCLS